MNTWTRAFVAVHVILSMMLAAGVVVFVNKTENFAVTMRNQSEAGARTKQQLTDERDAAANAQATAEKAVQDRDNQIASLKQELAATRQRATDQAAAVADLSSKLSMSSAENSKLAEALNASQATQGRLHESLVALREDADRYITRQVELDARVSDLSSNLEVTERERRYAAEQLAQAQQDVERMSRQLEELGYPQGGQQRTAMGQVGPQRGAPAINGVVREVFRVGDLPYATISVGTADSVARGMRFNVVDRDRGEFLGVLEVNNVDANEATGQLRGPAIDRIRQGMEVRTQL